MGSENQFPQSMDTLSTRKPRVDGVQARERILGAALRLFADQGYDGTSVREIAQAADVNIAAIAYYFGDKAGLYRAALFEPMCGKSDGADAFDAPGLDLDAALACFMRSRLRPLEQGAAARLSVRLRLREDIEPTGMLDDERSARMQTYRRLVALLGRHLAADPDPELDALALSIIALVAFPYYGHEKIRQCAPTLLDAPDALDAWAARLARYAAALVAAERKRRRAPKRRHTPTTLRPQ
jgi:TetR/AcrR family transcriptional regulator, regulator of cefoperazone and chloramphenicol sensitivity